MNKLLKILKNYKEKTLPAPETLAEKIFLKLLRKKLKKLN